MWSSTRNYQGTSVPVQPATWGVFSSTIRSKAKLLLHGMKSLCYGDPAAFNREAFGNQEDHHGLPLACGDHIQTDCVGSGGSLVPGLRPLYACVRPPVSCSLDVRRADPGGQPSGALSRHCVPESGAYLQPRSGTLDQHAALVYRLGRVVLARPAPLCPPLVGPPASCRMKGHAP